jgi:hypothetical protein
MISHAVEDSPPTRFHRRWLIKAADSRNISGGRPSEDEVEYGANSADRRPWQSCDPSGFDLCGGYRRFCLAASELLPPQFRLLFFDGALNRDVPKLDPACESCHPGFFMGSVSVEMDAARNHPPVASSLTVVLYENETSRIYLPHR